MRPFLLLVSALLVSGCDVLGTVGTGPTPLSSVSASPERVVPLRRRAGPPNVPCAGIAGWPDNVPRPVPVPGCEQVQ